MPSDDEMKKRWQTVIMNAFDEYRSLHFHQKNALYNAYQADKSMLYAISLFTIKVFFSKKNFFFLFL